MQMEIQVRAGDMYINVVGNLFCIRYSGVHDLSSGQCSLRTRGGNERKLMLDSLIREEMELYIFSFSLFSTGSLHEFCNICS